MLNVLKVALLAAFVAVPIVAHAGQSSAPGLTELSAQKKQKKPKVTKAKWNSTCYARYTGRELSYCLGHSRRPKK